MKLRRNHLLAYLSAGTYFLLSATAVGDEAYTDLWMYKDYTNQTQFTDLEYSAILKSDNTTQVTVTGGNHNGGDVCGAMSTANLAATNLTINGGSNLYRVIGGSSSYSFVEGDKNITINGGTIDYLYGGDWYVEPGRDLQKYEHGHTSAETYGVQSSTGVWVPKKSMGDIRITVNGGTIGMIYAGHVCADGRNIDPKLTPATDVGWYVDEDGNTTDKRPYSVGGNIYVEVNGGTVGKGDDAIRGTGGSWCSVDGSVNITVKKDAVINGNIYAGARDKYGQVGSTNVQIQGGSVTGNVFGGGSYKNNNSTLTQGDTRVSVSGGQVTGNIYGAGNTDIVAASTNVTISGGTIIGSVYGGGKNSTIGKGTHITLSGGSVSESIYGTGKGDTVTGDVTVQITGGDWSGNTIQALAEDATHTGGQAYLIIGSESTPYHVTLGSATGFDNLVVHNGSSFNTRSANIFGISSQTITLSATNLQQAVLRGNSAEVTNKGLTLNLSFDGKPGSGKYMIATTNSRSSSTVPTGWNAENVTVTGVATFNDLYWLGNTLYLSYEAPQSNAAGISNWGVFKSSQAFTGTLWGNRRNAVVLSTPTATDGKAPMAPATAKNIAWGAAYGLSGKIAGTGADHSVYGAAIGIERNFGTVGSSVGVAFGYDWGKVTPCTTTDVDQETWHAALYGRIGAWKAGKGAIAIDWSAAYGDTTSEHNDIAGSWSQDSWQLDLRATYAQAISARTTATVFAGVQYYTNSDAEVSGIYISSLQNLRLTAGTGLSYALTPRANLFGQASAYVDAMRHNPYAEENDIRLQTTNPGRIGGVFSVGADYAITDKWLLRGSYSFDIAKDSKEHNANLGVQYSF